jgi:hypothetical protein
MINVMRAILDTPPAVQKEVTPAVDDDGPQQAENSDGPLGTTMSKIDSLLPMLHPRKILRGQLL